MAGNKPIPKTQEEIAINVAIPYRNPDTGKEINPGPQLNTSKDRANQRSLKDDNVEPLKIGIKDIDEALYYYFNEVLKPSVLQNGKRINVPLVYGSPERWSAMQKDGFYRDKNGKMQAPLIVFRRNSIEKNRQLGNKLDGNHPMNYGIFEKKFSKKNVYDNFSTLNGLNNRVKDTEFYAVAIPDYVNIVYGCVIFTDYMEQNNKIIEGINFASDSYWGDPNKFKFRAMIDNYTTSTELVQGNDRIVKTEFSVNLLGHIITDTVNAQPYNNLKLYGKSNIKFNAETVSRL